MGGWHLPDNCNVHDIKPGQGGDAPALGVGALPQGHMKAEALDAAEAALGPTATRSVPWTCITSWPKEAEGSLVK